MRARARGELLAPPAHERIDGARVGHVVAFERGKVRVDFEGNPGAPAVARIAAGLDDAALAAAAAERSEGLLVFVNGDPRRPVLVALLRSETPLVDALLAGPLPGAEKAARVDGRTVVIEGREEIVLRCGKATLALRRDGRVILRGVEITTQADRVQKIRGGKVQVN